MSSRALFAKEFSSTIDGILELFSCPTPDEENSTKQDLSNSVDAFVKDATKVALFWKGKKPKAEEGLQMLTQFKQSLCNLLLTLYSCTPGRVNILKQKFEEHAKIMATNAKELVNEIGLKSPCKEKLNQIAGKINFSAESIRKTHLDNESTVVRCLVMYCAEVKDVVRSMNEILAECVHEEEEELEDEYDELNYLEFETTASEKLRILECIKLFESLQTLIKSVVYAVPSQREKANIMNSFGGVIPAHLSPTEDKCQNNSSDEAVSTSGGSTKENCQNKSASKSAAVSPSTDEKAVEGSRVDTTTPEDNVSASNADLVVLNTVASELSYAAENNALIRSAADNELRKQQLDFLNCLINFCSTLRLNAETIGSHLYPPHDIASLEEQMVLILQGLMDLKILLIDSGIASESCRNDIFNCLVVFGRFHKKLTDLIESGAAEEGN